MRKFIIAVLPVFALLVVVGWLATGSFITGLLLVFAGSALVAILMLWLTFVENHFDD
jgi:hypothetical protein